MPSVRKPPEVAARLVGQVADVLINSNSPRARSRLIPVVLRVAFLLHAESRGLLPAAERTLDREAKLLALADRVFADGGLLALRSPRVADRSIRAVIAALSIVDGVPVAYRDLEIEELGAMHESLLCEDSRRRSGSHYTPRTLTAPVVRTALAPVLAALGSCPTAEQILAIKICDPAMGAGAFLLEACRQLAELLARSTGMTAAAARRLVAVHCLHGVDKDPVAVDLAKLSLWLLVGDPEAPLTFLDGNLKCGDSLHAFVWARGFNSVFARDNPGFDVIVGNPPFMGGVRISGATSPEYLRILTAKFPGTGGQADLVAYFFRQSFNNLRNGGTLGLLATNTISQGATRKASLLEIVRSGGEIYAAERRVPWVGPAAVMPSAVWIIKNCRYAGPCMLDGVPHAKITAFLVPHGSSEDPQRLAANLGLVFKGVEPYGDGFVFEAGNPNANSLTTLARVRKTTANHARLLKYLGGEEFNTSPSQTATRWIIDFDEMTLAEAGRWPQLLNIVRRRVKPERATKAADVAAWPWWQFWRTRPELRRAMRGLRRVLVLADTSKHLSIGFVPTDQLLNKTLVVVALDEYAAFAVLQSRVHEVWARFFGSSMKADLRYTARDCFETFPFPPEWRTSAALERVGEVYHRFRGELMISAGQGLTSTYNRFHDSGEGAPEVQRLRALHGELDRAVLAAYGWDDVDTACEFVGTPGRLRWSQAVQDEVLARLLDLNHRSAGAR